MVACSQVTLRRFRWCILLVVGVLVVSLRPGIALGSDQKSQAGTYFYNDRVIVLNFHDIQLKPTGEWSMTPSKLEQTLTSLKQIGFHFITPLQFSDFLSRNAVIPADALMVTFDDGLEDMYTYAYPILQKLQIPCIENVIGSRIGTTAASLTADQLNEMKQSGLVWIGGHSYDLHHDETVGKAAVPAVLVLHRDENDFLRMVRLQSDATQLQSVIRNDTGEATPFYACPYGSYDEVYLSTLYNAGFQYVFNSQPGAVYAGSDIMRLPRVDIGHEKYSFFQIVMAIRCAALGNQQALWQAGKIVLSDQNTPKMSSEGAQGTGLTAALPGVPTTP